MLLQINVLPNFYSGGAYHLPPSYSELPTAGDTETLNWPYILDSRNDCVKNHAREAGSQSVSLRLLWGMAALVLPLDVFA